MMGKNMIYLLVVAVTVLALSITTAERVNSSGSGGLYWTTEDDDGNISGKTQGEESTGSLNELDEYDGGFSSLDGMLQWAIGHSDPSKLKEKAEDAQKQSPDELKRRQMEIKDLVEKLKTPSDAQLMQIAINDLNNSSLPIGDHYRALQELLILVEPIDNANDLHKLGGLSVTIKFLSNSNAELRTMSAWILGQASQNNPVVQKQILELGGLIKLMKMVKSSVPEEARKALYAVSALIRNNELGQESFYAESGILLLQDIMGNSSVDIILRRKSVFLVADLVESLMESEDKPKLPFFSNHSFLKSIVDLTSSNDLDLQEKALFVIKNLLQLRTTEAVVLKDLCGLDDALKRIRVELLQLMTDENISDYAKDIEILRSEVEIIFHQKLEKEILIASS